MKPRRSFSKTENKKEIGSELEKCRDRDEGRAYGEPLQTAALVSVPNSMCRL